MDIDEDSSKSSNIIEVNRPERSDPRLRTKKSSVGPLTDPVATLSQDELMEKAKLQIATLAKMEKGKQEEKGEGGGRRKWKK